MTIKDCNRYGWPFQDDKGGSFMTRSVCSQILDAADARICTLSLGQTR